MSIYAVLDSSDKTTHVCVVDAEGAILRREVLASDPDLLAKWLGRYCPTLVRVILETGPLSAFLPLAISHCIRSACEYASLRTDAAGRLVYEKPDAPGRPRSFRSGQ